MLLAVVRIDEEELIEVHCDCEGIALLIETLTRLARCTTPDHDHLMTPSWGGWELTEDKLGEDTVDTVLVNHVKIYFWPQGRPGNKS